MSKINFKKIKNVCEDFLTKLGVEGKVEVIEEASVVSVNIKTPDSGLLIGYHGQTLMALELLLMSIIYQKIPLEELGRMVLDVEGYKKEQEGKLSAIIERIIDKVRKTGQSEILRPMKSYERRQVHILLKDQEGLISESLGEEPDRRVVIRSVGK